MTAPHVVPLTPAQFAAAKRSATLTPAELRANLSASARHSYGSRMLARRFAS